jgi:hypothetical protein
LLTKRPLIWAGSLKLVNYDDLPKLHDFFVSNNSEETKEITLHREKLIVRSFEIYHTGLWTISKKHCEDCPEKGSYKVKLDPELKTANNLTIIINSKGVTFKDNSQTVTHKS